MSAAGGVRPGGGRNGGEVRAKGGTEQCVILGGAATQHRQVRLSYATVYPSSLGCCGAGAQWPAPSGAQLVAVTMLSTVHHLPCWRLRLWLRCGSTLVWQSHCGGYRVFSCVSTTPPAAPRCRLFAVCLSGDYTFGCAATAHCSGGGAVSCTVGRAASCVRECPSVGCNTLSRRDGVMASPPPPRRRWLLEGAGAAFHVSARADSLHGHVPSI